MSVEIDERAIPVMPECTRICESLGLDPREMRYIGVKSSAHFRAGFEPWAGAIHVVNEPGVHDMDTLTFRRLGRKLYPLDHTPD